MATMEQVWRGCRLAAVSADYWHAAHDFDSRTLCGLPVRGMTERDDGHRAMCPRCAAAAATTVTYRTMTVEGSYGSPVYATDDAAAVAKAEAPPYGYRVLDITDHAGSLVLVIASEGSE